jgi:hypothetical protein
VRKRKRDEVSGNMTNEKGEYKEIAMSLNLGFHLSATSTAIGSRGLAGCVKSRKKGGEFK